MKNNSLLLIMAIALGALSSCNDKFTESYTANVPEYMNLDDWRAMDIAAENPRDLSEPGKIYIYQDYLFIVERGVGVHILNNANPAAPQNLAFLTIPGCVDLAVFNNALYVDSYYDLLSFDISDPAQPDLQCRIADAFDFDNWTLIKGYQDDLPFTGIDPAKGVIVSWSQKEISRDAVGYESINFNNDFETAIGTGMGAINDAAVNIGSSTGIGGSMAQFTVTGNFLYVLRPASITSFNLGSDLCPQQSSVTPVGWNAETIFPYNNHLFLGTSSGMMIFNLNNPSTPEYVSAISHLTACDPVVVQDNRAYVTVRSGTACQGFINQLMVIDISDYNAPALLAEYNLTNPHGLGIDGNTLFICDGSAGLKVFDAADDMTITDHLISHYQQINTFDVIPYNDVLIMSAKEGIYQYDYSDPLNIEELSLIPVN
ncbi:hypothetical protein G3O08_12790 [Cryomorpha ignava]|uniref:LVIVD repeat-containing protein n=1 Tax=Cryomorpha ignava TaxID=101383 RepID=A0A7K3WTN0_9FLAO|nr:hypothetical protein [Cryomorpha ignava]NEN24381.1 hypothetical protein [Cryomorpha ignava]